METETVFAWTETDGASYPGYVNIQGAAGEQFQITVRSPGNNGNTIATLMVPKEVLAELVQKAKSFVE